MGSLEHIGQHYSLGEQQLSDDEACHEEDDDDQGGGDVPHAGSNQDIDFSGYVDEYGFMPLTPSLETALTDALSSMEDAGNGSPVTSLTFIEGQMIDEMTELARLGYLDQPSKYLDGRAAFRVTSKGARYMVEKHDYIKRKDAWAAARRHERRSDALFQVVVALFSFLGGIVCAVIGGMVST